MQKSLVIASGQSLGIVVPTLTIMVTTYIKDNEVGRGGRGTSPTSSEKCTDGLLSSSPVL